MFTLAGLSTSIQEIKRSRFVTNAAPVSSEAEARDFFASIADITATHNCTAWRIGQIYRFNDDGEPVGTAGKPILQAIDGQKLDGVVVVVTRFYGGIKLGAGGLIRAYSGCAASCLREAEKVELIAKVEALVSCQFSDLALVKARLLEHEGVVITQEDFHESGADLTLNVPIILIETLSMIVADCTSGRAELLVEG